MKKSTLIRIGLALGLPALAVGVAWLGGFNFDARNESVSFWAIITLTVTATAVTWPIQ